VNGRIPIVCLGSGAALNDGRGWNSLLIDGRILLDLSPSAITQIHRLGIDPRTIEVIFISHLHADHLFGIPFLFLEYRIRYERSSPLHIVGPAGLPERIESLCTLAWPELDRGGLGTRIEPVYTIVREEGEYEAAGLKFTAIPMEHFGLSAFGYRFTHKGKTFAYTGDTGEGESAGQLLEGVDVAIVELTHPGPVDDPGHLDVEGVSRLTKELVGRGATVLATHMSETPPPIEGITLCEDGKTYWV